MSAYTGFPEKNLLSGPGRIALFAAKVFTGMIISLFSVSCFCGAGAAAAGKISLFNIR